MEELYRINVKEDKFVDFLFITPYCNAGRTLASAFEGRMKILLTGVKKAEDVLFDLFSKGLIVKNLIFNNASIYSERTINYAKDNNIKVSSHEQGWFPHYQTLHFDPLGFSSHSLLAKSRLDNIDINIDKIKDIIKNYKNTFAVNENIFKLNKPYILLITQHTGDATIQHDYNDFESWQKIIDFADKIKKKNELLVIKINPQNVKSKDVMILPHGSIAIQNKCFNNDLLANANAVIGVNSTMLYEASLLYDKPVIALGDSWFNCHPEVVQKAKIIDENIEIRQPSEKDISYRKKMFYIMTKMQTPIISSSLRTRVKDFLMKHEQANSIKKIEDWMLPFENTDFEPYLNKEVSIKKKIFIKKHLGGHRGRSHIDEITLDYLVDKYNIKTMVDVGCGPGKQVELAIAKGLKAEGIDGDPDLDIYNKSYYIKHDYTESPLKTKKYDLCWSVEFLEHVEEKYIPNFFETIIQCKIACVTFALPGKGGYHHVNCQTQDYWIKVFHQYGFQFNEKETSIIRKNSKLRFIRNTGCLFIKK